MTTGYDQEAKESLEPGCQQNLRDPAGKATRVRALESMRMRAHGGACRGEDVGAWRV